MIHSHSVLHRSIPHGAQASAGERGKLDAYIEALPGEAALEEEDEGVCEGFHVIPPAGSTPQVSVRAGIAHSPPACSHLSIKQPEF